MTGGGGREDPPSLPRQSVPLNSGDFLPRLVQNSPHMSSPDTHSSPSAQQRTHTGSPDPAIAAVGPSIPLPINSTRDRPSPSPHHPRPTPPPPSNNSFSPPCPHNLFRRGFPHNPPCSHHQSSPPTLSNFSLPHLQVSAFQQQREHHSQEHSKFMFENSPIQIPNERNNSASLILRERESGFVSGDPAANRYDGNPSLDSRMKPEHQRHSGTEVYGSPEMRRSGPPLGFSGAFMNQRRSVEHIAATQTSSSSSELNNRASRFSSKDREGERIFSSEFGCFNESTGIGLSGQLHRPGMPAGSSLCSVSASDIEDPMLKWQAEMVNNGEGEGDWKADNLQNSSNGHEMYHDEFDDLREQLVDSMIIEEGSTDKMDKMKHHHRDKDFRSDPRGQRILTQKMRNLKRYVECRSDIDRLSSPFLVIYDSLIPAAEEKAKQKQLLALLENLVHREWPHARLYLYGSCANSFGVSKSDIDVCLTIDDKDINKSDILLRLAEILQSDNIQDVQALRHARVPIVKLKDPVTRVSCDICINNVLAVVNTKLLRDYAEIDARLRQLVFIVKHWAKSRGVNETYRGTLSSYAYVLMCIHFLQQCRPAILPCLQEMEPTYVVTVDNVTCAYFDQVAKLRHFGARNKENIAQLVWAFFNYWAHCHDFSNSVISVRTGSILSKQRKDWTRRIGNDRHLICIEDPFETSHDLGRVVDKNSIRVLREEFERAADIMQYDPNPCRALFEAYVPR